MSAEIYMRVRGCPGVNGEQKVVACHAVLTKTHMDLACTQPTSIERVPCATTMLIVERIYREGWDGSGTKKKRLASGHVTTAVSNGQCAVERQRLMIDTDI